MRQIPTSLKKRMREKAGGKQAVDGLRPRVTRDGGEATLLSGRSGYQRTGHSADWFGSMCREKLFSLLRERNISSNSLFPSAMDYLCIIRLVVFRATSLSFESRQPGAWL